MTHLDTDHYGGIVSLCQEGMVRQLVVYEGHAADVPQIGMELFVDKSTVKRWHDTALTHVVVPIASIIDFFVTGVYGDIQKKHIPYVTLPPLAYVIYATIAYIAGVEFAPGKNYPYFFLNWDSPAGAFGFCKGLPFMGCVWWILLLSLLILGVGLIYVLLLNKMKRDSNSIYQKQR